MRTFAADVPIREKMRRVQPPYRSKDISERTALQSKDVLLGSYRGGNRHASHEWTGLFADQGAHQWRMQPPTYVKKREKQQENFR